MRLVFSKRAFASIVSETAAKIRTETGGLFLGQFLDNTWYIIDAIDPGINAVFEVAYFEYDRYYTMHLANKVANLYVKPLRLIGLWHRHPGAFCRFSSTDDVTNLKYANLNPEIGAISALVNMMPSFNLTVFHVDRECRYTRVEYIVDDDLIPTEFRSYIEKVDLNGRVSGGNNSDDERRAHFKILKNEICDIIDVMPKEAYVPVSVNDDRFFELLLQAVEDDVAYLEEKCFLPTLARKGNCLKIGSEFDKSFGVFISENIGNDGFICSYGNKWHTYHSRTLRDGLENIKMSADAEPEKQGFVALLGDKIKCLMEKLKRNIRY